MSETKFDRDAMLRRAKERGGTASMIVCGISNDFKNSDLRADNPAILNAFNERFELLESQRDDLLAALKACEKLLSAIGHRYLVATIDARAAIAKAEGR